MESIFAALITGILALVGVVITNVSGNRSVRNKLERNQAVTDTKLEELTREVREHNHFAIRVPVMEEKIRVLEHRVKHLEFEGEYYEA